MKPGDHPEFFRFPAPAGTSRESTIRLDREGRFWHDGAPVEHPKLADALHSWIARHPDDGRWILTNGYDWTYFTVDDTAFVVRSVEGADVPELRLSNGALVPLDPDRLTLGADGALYARVRVKDLEADARFTRFAQNQLAPWLVEEDDGSVAIRVGGRLARPSPRESPKS